MCRMHTVLALLALYIGLAHSWDFAVGKEDLLEFYAHTTKTETVRFKSQNISALAYDEIHDMILYVDKQSDNDAICGYHMSSSHYKYLTERNGRNIHSIAFDPATELLFFTDTKDRSINWISLKPGSKNNVYGNLLIKMDDSIPTDIAVDSCRGFIYWINTNLTSSPTIERARFDGSYREVVIHSTAVSISSTYKLQPHSIAVDQQTKRIYWFEPSAPQESDIHYAFCSVDLIGQNKNIVDKRFINFDNTTMDGNPSNTVTVSKESIFAIGWCPTCSLVIFGLHGQEYKVASTFAIHQKVPTSIAANYKVSDQIKGSRDCKPLTSLVQNNSLFNETFKIATEYVEGFCIHGMQIDGQFPCKCLPGYIGERCNVSVCENYCLQGSCSFNDDGLSKCRCNAGYSGERCEVNLCHGYCQNDGNCSLNDKSEPACKCKENFAGVRCEVSACLNYCFQGKCSVNDEGLPKCRCDVGYSGERCEVNACHGYCLNSGECSINEEDELVCQCLDNYYGSRCEVTKNGQFTNTHTSFTPNRNLTLADLLSNWRKPISKVTVIMESS